MDTSVKLGKAPYYTPQTGKTKDDLRHIANMSDTDIMLSSIAKTERDSKKSLAAKASKVITPATVGAFILADMAKAAVKSGDVIKKAPPSIKLLTGGASLISWIAAFKSFDIAGKASEKLADKTDNENLKNGIVAAGTIGGGAALYLGAKELASRGAAKFVKSMPDTVNELGKKAASFDKAFFENGIVKTLQRNIGEPVANFAAKHARLSNFASRNSSLIILGLSVLSGVLLGTKIVKDKSDSLKENADRLYRMREEARIATDMLNSSESAYDNKIENDGFRVNVEKVIKTAESDKQSIDPVLNEALEDALD